MKGETAVVEGLADNIFEVDAYSPTEPVPFKDNFLPWHRPRKHFVRDSQWRKEIQRLVENSKAASGGTLNYLGLPGVDLLDLRYFHSTICQSQKVGLRFLGFVRGVNANSSESTELNISLDEVRKLSNVDPLSEVLADDFSLLSNQHSVAFQKAKKLGPYDVINLDLCDGFGSQGPGECQVNYYDAVRNLLTIQSRNPNPWLLFLTTRADKENIHTETLLKLVEDYKNSLHLCDSFRDASSARFSICEAEHIDLAVGEAEGLLQVFLTGLSKWFITLGLSYRPPFSAKAKTQIGYRVFNTAVQQDLVSLVFKFMPHQISPHDPIGLATQTPEMPDECLLATAALQKVADRIDADERLASDQDLLARMVEQTANLLSLARYDVGEYKKWVNNGCVPK